MRSSAIAGLFLLTALAARPQTPKAVPQNPGRRLALVIGNQYANSKLPPLPAAPKEVALIKSSLENAGFKVTSVLDAGLTSLKKDVNSFADQVQPDDICVVYYSGYAAQNGEDDFLLPVDFDPSVTGGLYSGAYQITALAAKLQVKQAGLKLIFLEGARKIGVKVADANLPGLFLPDTSDLTEVLLGIPNGANQPIDTPPDQVGLFTKALAQAIDRKGEPLSELMSDVLGTVMKESPGQQPTSAMKLTRRFYFHEPDIAPPPTPVHIPLQNRIDRETYVFIPPGKFLMGCVPSDTKCDKSEKPQHEVTITKGFWMGQTEVRVVSYKRFISVDKTKSRKMPSAPDWNKKWEQHEDHPISWMKWEDAEAYCSWAGGRLPTEAEWEYAARGGKSNRISPLQGEEDGRAKANFFGKSGNDIFDNTAPVKSFDANDFGLYDMAGNVWEFVNDWFAPDYYSNSPAVDPTGPASGKQHVRRGGSFYSDPKKHLRTSLREPSNAENNVGFRCVLDDTGKTKQILQP